mmetsp:Transcript_31985/g.106755  ORF Transcript_31985/g.106755 Transcript_31985/m.106755 type:complete len:201 (-) Transcript_31985:261-863(-)
MGQSRRMLRRILRAQGSGGRGSGSRARHPCKHPCRSTKPPRRPDAHHFFPREKKEGRMSAAAEAVFGDDNLRAFIVQCRTEAMQAMRIQKVRLSMMREIRELFTPAFVSRWCSEDFMDAWPEFDVWGGLRLPHGVQERVVRRPASHRAFAHSPLVRLVLRIRLVDQVFEGGHAIQPAALWVDADNTAEQAAPSRLDVAAV